MKYTGICYNCKMKIPKGANICPYCHTKNPDTVFSTKEDIIVVVFVVLVGAIFVLLLQLIID